MPVVIEQTFPLGRFHATRWGQNPFEDRLGEWPPSPWRLLRALAARWFQYQLETGVGDTSLRDELLRALAAELPAFRLPAQTWRGIELRQYQPTALELQYKYKNGRLDYSFRQVSRTLALDSYRAVSPEESTYWIWQSCNLSRQATDLLRELLRRIHYFGRAEAWAILRMVESSEGIIPNCELRVDRFAGSVPVLAYRADQDLDIGLLLANTSDKRLSNRRIPPGTAWFYAKLPSYSWRSVPSVVLQDRSRIQIVRYALDSTVLPLVTETLPVAEAARRALMGIHGRLTERNSIRGRSDVLSGKDEQGQPLTAHGHAYYLPTDEDHDGRLDHLTIYARDGFGLDEQRACDRLRELRTGRPGEERYPLRLLLLGMGTLEEFGRGPLQASKVWVSTTPYVATRYAKTRGRHRIDLRSPDARAAFLIEDLRSQLREVRPDIAGEVTIEPLWDQNKVFAIADRWRPIQFKRFRWKVNDDGGRRLAGAFRLTFSAPVRGPIALGHSCHFGLGQFVPAGRE